jgi:hypothetical protein
VTVLGQRALNRALLERQMLLERSTRGLVEVVEHLVAVQAQVPGAPYLGLWSRVAGFDPDDLGRRITDLSMIRMPTLRCTMHLTSADDALALRPITAPLLKRTFLGQFAKQLAGIDVEEVAAAGLELLDRPMSVTELGRLLAERWPGPDPAALGYAVQYCAPLAQVPPRGVWGRSGRAKLDALPRMLGRPLLNDVPADELVLRYLRAFGPASTADARAFTGVGGLKEVVERLDLRRFADERGRELLDVPDGPLPDPDTPAPPRFLGEYDNIMLGHDDRTRVLATEHRPRVLPGAVRPLLVDGMVAAEWTSGPDGIEVKPFARLSDTDASDVIAEGERLLDALFPDSTRKVSIRQP